MNRLPPDFPACPAAVPRLVALLAIVPTALFLAASQARASAGPPYLTDDPDTPEHRHWEIAVAVTHEQRGAERDFEAPLVEVSYGVRPNTELSFSVPYVAKQEEADRAKALGTLEFGLKWRFYERAEEESKKKLVAVDAVSVAPQIGLPSPNSSAAAKEIVSSHPVLVLPAEVGAHCREWSLNAELGWILQSRQRSRLFAGGVVSRSLGRCTLGVELYTAEPTCPARRIVAANVGASVILGESYALLVSIGRELVNRQEERAGLLAYLGVQYSY